MYDIDRLIEDMAGEIRAVLTRRGIDKPLLVGIHTGGVWLAQRLQALLEIHAPLGILDISFYRDDFSRVGMNPQIKPSELPFDVESRDLILVDDVLYTGRTVRAALNELFDYGRPDSVLLAVLVDRGGRELPIEANAVGARIALAAGENIKLTGPEPLRLSIQKSV